MQGMSTLKAVVRGRRLVIDQEVDYPEGTEIELTIVDELSDDLDEDERKERDAAIDAAWHSYKSGGKTYSKQEALEKLRARR